ncbi:hypothetical protein DAPPUDRAFT_105013 [Daphnia pulex]|uniref:Uncharacterized protein n=1 Tax=Daphnia pulex TaxID=6669 RepID=E9GP44_DAPPU|nr:hypothetical protein DAPPUDRAFT_105013 [Daphnia pulex]|eukprot:EFX78746.1 hypothetical protein DAPPUDRAFT_105013 [Daphnia pulex]
MELKKLKSVEKYVQSVAYSDTQLFSSFSSDNSCRKSIKKPTRKICTTVDFVELCHNSPKGKAFAVECLNFITPKWSSDRNYQNKRKRSHSSSMTSTSVAGSNPSSNTTLTTSNVQLQIEPQTPGADSSPSSNTTLTMSNLQLPMEPQTPGAGSSPSLTQHWHRQMCNFKWNPKHLELVQVPVAMLEIDPFSRNGSTPGSNTMSNLPSFQDMTTNMPVAGPSGISHTSYKDLGADFQMQEMERFRHPNKPFTYRLKRQHKADYTVGPVRAGEENSCVSASRITDIESHQTSFCFLCVSYRL